MAPSPERLLHAAHDRAEQRPPGHRHLRRLLRAHRQGSRRGDDEAGQQRRGRSRRAALIRPVRHSNAMPPSPSDLPPWLRRSGAAPRGTKGRAAATAIALGAGGVRRGRGRGLPVRAPGRRRRRGAAAAPAGLSAGGRVPAPSGADRPPRTRTPRPASKRAKPAQKALSPLPDKPRAGRGGAHAGAAAFADKKAPELRDCVAEPDRGPTLKLGRRVRDRLGRRRRFRADPGRGRSPQGRQALLRPTT